MKTTKLTTAELKKLQQGLKASKESGNFWNPSKAGESIYGTVTKIAESKNKKGNKVIKSKLVTIETSKGESGFWLKSVLEKKFAELNIKAGDKIAVEYLGAKMEGKKVQYHKYAVAKL